MIVFFDTNILIDIAAVREPFFDDSYRAFSRSMKGGRRVVVSALTICTLAYFMRKHLDKDSLRGLLRKITDNVGVVPVGEAAVKRAIELFASDFEDEVQHQSALAANANLVVTRDKTGFAGAKIPVLTPTEFLSKEIGGTTA